MDAETVGAILREAFKAWGLTALFLLCLITSLVVSAVQVFQIRRWQPETREVARILSDIAEKLDRQHSTCTRHYDFAQQQITGMQAIGQEMRAVVEAITASDRERTREIMQLMTVIAGRGHP